MSSPEIPASDGGTLLRTIADRVLVERATGVLMYLLRLDAEEAAAEHGIRLEVVKLPEAKRGFVLLPRRWVVERSFAWAARFRRLARDYERLPQTLAGYHWLVFAVLMLGRAGAWLADFAQAVRCSS